MFTEVVYLYNVFLIVLYSTTLALALAALFKEKNKKRKKLFSILSLYLIFFILDNSIISMTEIIENFASLYNQRFQGTSFIKTSIFLVNNFCQLWLVNFICKKKINRWEYLSLIAIFIFMLLPFLPTSSLKVYLYYLPNQLLLFYVGLKALFYSKNSELDKLRKKYLDIIAKLALAFSLLILLEDTFIIFHLDQYKAFNSKIINRNLSEDLFSISICVLAIYYLFKDSSLTSLVKPELPQDIRQDFFKNYRLTEREQEICHLLLEQKNNQEIAEDLYLSVGTVKTHVHNIYIKMDIKKREQLFSLYQDYLDQNT